jgi:hypothetical protein
VVILITIILIVIGHTVLTGSAQGVMLGVGYGVLGGVLLGFGSGFAVWKLGSLGAFSSAAYDVIYE